MHRTYFLVLLFMGFSLVSFAQLHDTAGAAMRLKDHVGVLASDKFGGRLTGTKYEKMASDYIVSYYKKYDLQPLGNSKDYLQAFTFTPKIELGKKNSLKVDRKYEVNDEWYPLPVSANGEIAGAVINLDEGMPKSGDFTADMKGKIVLVNLEMPDDADPHDPSLGWRSRLEAAAKVEPAAVILYNSPYDLSIEGMRGISHIQPYKFLVVHVKQEVVEQLKTHFTEEPVALGKAIAGGLHIQIAVDLKKPEKTGHNVIGYIDNKAASTIVIGAHYDHLGKGEYGSSLSTAKNEIHNGADDNASGTAVLMELAKQVREAKLTRHNYIFIAFSGEELGLLGSNFFARHLPNELPKVIAMLNMDMVGRLDKGKKELGINGTGTSPVWDSLLELIRVDDIRIKTTTSGMGSSDHTSFYLQDIPALHFFTGVHPDYHKPTDDMEKLNYPGMADVTEYIFKMIQHLESLQMLEFTKTKNDSTTVPHFKVTLGIMPDYFYDKGGLRVEGVTEGKPASVAGMKDGDIIIRLGDVPVRDIMSYMQALSRYSSGDEVEVEVKRDEQTKTLKVKF